MKGKVIKNLEYVVFLEIDHSLLLYRGVLYSLTTRLLSILLLLRLLERQEENKQIFTLYFKWTSFIYDGRHQTHTKQNKGGLSTILN